MIRDCTIDDVPWMGRLAAMRYVGMEEGYVPAAAEQWATRLIGQPDVIAVRGEHSAAMAFVVRPAWAPGTAYCDLGMIWSEPKQTPTFEPVRLLRAIDQRRRALGCSRFFLHSSFADLSPLARRIGAVQLAPSFVVV